MNSPSRDAVELRDEAAAMEREWCRAVDSHDLDAIQDAFVRDGTFVTRGRAMDADGRAEFFRGIWESEPSRSTHVCRDVTATETDSGVAVTARLSATFVLPDGSVRVAWGRYDDLAVRTDRGLRLKEKAITLHRVELLEDAGSD